MQAVSESGRIRVKNNRLFKTNAVISLILLIGFALTAALSYHANYRTSLDSMEQISTLTADGICYQLTAMFTKPVNVSLTMSHDSLLREHLSKETEYLEDEKYVDTTRNYLDTYREKYGFDSVFLVSAATSRYYNFNGIDRVLTEDSPENAWYYDLLKSDAEYSMNVDNDEVEGADNVLTVFVNCKVKAGDGSILGIVGVGIRIDYLEELLRTYEDKFNVTAGLLGEDGTIEISTARKGHVKTDWFELNGRHNIRGQILDWREKNTNLEIWADKEESGGKELHRGPVYSGAELAPGGGTEYGPAAAWNPDPDNPDGNPADYYRRVGSSHHYRSNQEFQQADYRADGGTAGKLCQSYRTAL